MQTPPHLVLLQAKTVADDVEADDAKDDVMTHVMSDVMQLFSSVK